MNERRRRSKQEGKEMKAGGRRERSKKLEAVEIYVPKVWWFGSLDEQHVEETLSKTPKMFK